MAESLRSRRHCSRGRRSPLGQKSRHLRKAIEVARVVYRLPHAQAALEPPGLCKACSDADIDPAEHLGLLPVMRRLRNQVALAPEKRRRDVVEAADLFAAVRQPTICRRGNTVGIEVGRRHSVIVGGQKAAIPGAIVGEVDTDPWPQLVLQGNRTLPVVVLFVVAFTCIVSSARAGGSNLTEAEVIPRATLAVDSRTSEVTIRDVIAIRIVPGARRAGRL